MQAKAKVGNSIVEAKQAVDARAGMVVSAVATVVEGAKATAQPYAALVLGASHAGAAPPSLRPPPRERGTRGDRVSVLCGDPVPRHSFLQPWGQESSPRPQIHLYPGSKFRFHH